jgi:hypothetical protein
MSEQDLATFRHMFPSGKGHPGRSPFEQAPRSKKDGRFRPLHVDLDEAGRPNHPDLLHDLVERDQADIDVTWAEQTSLGGIRT